MLPSIVAVMGLPAVPAAARAQESQPFSLDQVAEAVAADLGTRILDRARVSCVSFVVDATTERRLRAAGADASFTTALRDVCHEGTSLRVTTDPAGAEVWVQERLVGRSPWTSPMPALRNTVVEVRRGGRQRRLTVDLVADSLVTVALAMPRDTSPLPPLPPESELQSLRARAGNFDARSRPTPPTPPAQGRGVTSTILGGVAGAAAGFAAGTLLCRRDVQQYESDTVAGVPFRRPAGTTTELRHGCVGFSFGGAATTSGSGSTSGSSRGGRTSAWRRSGCGRWRAGAPSASASPRRTRRSWHPTATSARRGSASSPRCASRARCRTARAPDGARRSGAQSMGRRPARAAR